MKRTLEQAVLAAANASAMGLMGSGSPLAAAVVVAVWVSAEDTYSCAPVALGDPATFPYLVESLRLLCEKLEAGDYRILTDPAPGGAN